MGLGCDQGMGWWTPDKKRRGEIPSFGAVGGLKARKWEVCDAKKFTEKGLEWPTIEVRIGICLLK